MSHQGTIVSSSPARFTASTAVMTACVAVVTMVFQVYIPATKGYFNLGDSMVYISALLFGPLAGALSGGLGSMMADLFSGFWIYAPATLVIKGVEGFVVGILSQRLRPEGSKRIGWGIPILVGLAIGAYFAAVGTTFYSGMTNLSGGGGTWWSVDLIVEPIAWITISALAAILIAYVTHRSRGAGVIAVLSMLLGGAVMVSGYFLYQQLILGLAAILEVPFNIMQCLLGIVIALPTYRRIRQAIPV